MLMNLSWVAKIIFELSLEKITDETPTPFFNVFNFYPDLRSHKITVESIEPVKTLVLSFEIATLVMIFK